MRDNVSKYKQAEIVKSTKAKQTTLYRAIETNSKQWSALTALRRAIIHGYNYFHGNEDCAPSISILQMIH